jgi:hypothetical protein
MKIPIGYEKVTAEEIQVDDVVREVGKVVDVWVEDEAREWTSLATGRNYMMGSLIIITESCTEGEYLDWSFPLTSIFEVLRYAKLLNFEDENLEVNPVLQAKPVKTTLIFSSSN